MSSLRARRRRRRFVGRLQRGAFALGVLGFAGTALGAIAVVFYAVAAEVLR